MYTIDNLSYFYEIIGFSRIGETTGGGGGGFGETMGGWGRGSWRNNGWWGGGVGETMGGGGGRGGGGVGETMKGQIVNYTLLKCYSKWTPNTSAACVTERFRSWATLCLFSELWDDTASIIGSISDTSTLSALEAIYIKRRKPIINTQKELRSNTLQFAF